MSYKNRSLDFADLATCCSHYSEQSLKRQQDAVLLSLTCIHVLKALDSESSQATRQTYNSVWLTVQSTYYVSIVIMHKITQLELSFPNHKRPNTCRLQMIVRLMHPLGPQAARPVAHGANSSLSVICVLPRNMKMLPSSVWTTGMGRKALCQINCVCLSKSNRSQLLIQVLEIKKLTVLIWK